MLRYFIPRLPLIFMLSILLAGCSGKLSKNSYSAKIESEGTTGGSFIYRPIIVFVDDRKIEDYSTKLAPKKTTLNVAVQKEYSAAGVYIDEPITKIISQSPKGEITFVPETGKNTVCLERLSTNRPFSGLKTSPPAKWRPAKTPTNKSHSFCELFYPRNTQNDTYA